MSDAEEWEEEVAELKVTIAKLAMLVMEMKGAGAVVPDEPRLTLKERDLIMSLVLGRSE